jgi:hypothetical protein
MFGAKDRGQYRQAAGAVALGLLLAFGVSLFFLTAMAGIISR